MLKPKIKLKAIRKESNMTQTVFSERVSMDQAQYNRRETGKLPISDSEWIRFAKALDVDVEQIKELDSPVINITHNHGENDSSINGYEITIKLPKSILDTFHDKLDILIDLLRKKD